MLMSTHLQAYLGSYQTSMMEFFFQTLSNFEQIGPNILLEFRKISLRIYTLITSRVLVSAPSSVIQTLDDF